MTDITLPRDVAEQVLKALESMKTYAETVEPGLNVGVPIIAVLRARLSQREQEPVAWIYEGGHSNLFGLDRTLHWYKPPSHGTPLYTAPPPRTWVDLTDDEVKHEWEIWRANVPRYAGFAKGIGAKLKEKNT